MRRQALGLRAATREQRQEQRPEAGARACTSASTGRRILDWPRPAPAVPEADGRRILEQSLDVGSRLQAPALVAALDPRVVAAPPYLVAVIA